MLSQERVDAILDEMSQIQLGQILITDPMAIYYLLGYLFDPGERFLGLLLRIDGHHALIVNRLFPIHENLGVNVVIYDDRDPILEMLCDYLDPRLRLGVDKNLPARFLLPMQERRIASSFMDSSFIIDTIRGIKREDEQELMKEASRVNDLAMEKFKKLIRTGISEREVAAKMLRIYQSLGASDFSFSPLVAFGANAADPHHVPDGTVVMPGDNVLLDVGCRKDMYCSDMTRTFFFEKVSSAHREIYEIVRRANERAIDGCKPGMLLKDVDALARDDITKKGYGDYFTHRLGHFIGLDVHEAGDVSASNDAVVKPGMIFSIEPGIYLPNEMGVRIEDLVLVTEQGCEVLNHYSKELEIITDLDE